MDYLSLTDSVAIPTSARVSVKSYIAGAPGFAAFEAEKGIPSRNFTKAQWFEAARRFGIEAPVLSIINGAWAQANGGQAVPAVGTVVDGVVVDDGIGEAETVQDAPAASTGPARGYSVDDVLSDARDFLSPRIVQSLEAKIAPLVAAANKPAEKIIQRIVETITNDPGPRPGEEATYVPFARKGETTTIGKALGLRGRHAQTPVSVWDGKDAPAVDPHFVPNTDIVAPIVTAMERSGVNVWLHGPAGTGKTSYPLWIAAKLKRPFVRIAFNRSLEPLDLFGCDGLDGKGGMVWRDGALTKAIRRPGTIILLDEISFAPPGALASLQTLLDHRFVTLTSGEVVRCAEGVFFVAADNTAGYGDMSGVYAGTNIMNAALNERFGRMIKVEYMSAAQETAALVNHTGLVKPAAQRVVKFMQDVRSGQAKTGTDSRPLSIRQLVGFVQLTQDGFAPEIAFDMAVLSRLPDAEREALNALYKANFDSVAYETERTGQAPAQDDPNTPAAYSDDPTQVEARNTFEPVGA